VGAELKRANGHDIAKAHLMGDVTVHKNAKNATNIASLEHTRTSISSEINNLLQQTS